uniref:Uncharacterized protein n=1 Tax=viral metagenome TaxID=1070528 RepID=A0A6M3KVK4_9ZZZZ
MDILVVFPVFGQKPYQTPELYKIFGSANLAKRFIDENQTDHCHLTFRQWEVECRTQKKLQKI